MGQVPNVVFVEGMVRRTDRFCFYYGGADTNVGVAEVDREALNDLCLTGVKGATPTIKWGSCESSISFLLWMFVSPAVCSRPSIAFRTTSESRSSRSDRNLRRHRREDRT